MKVSESNMDAKVTQLFQQKMMMYCWMINYYETTGIVKNATTNSFYLLCGFLRQITIFVMNLWSYVTPRVIFWIVICW